MDRQEAEAALTKAKERTRHARTALEDAIAHLEDGIPLKVHDFGLSPEAAEHMVYV